MAHGMQNMAKPLELQPLDFSDLAKHLLLIHHFGTHDMLVLCWDQQGSMEINWARWAWQHGNIRKLARGCSGYSGFWVLRYSCWTIWANTTGWMPSECHLNAIWMPSECHLNAIILNPSKPCVIQAWPSANSGQSHVLQWYFMISKQR